MKTKASFPHLKLAVSRTLCAPWLGHLIGRLSGDRIRYRGLKLDVRGVELPSSTKALLFWGFYESAEYRFVCAHLRSDLDVIEMGSGIGAISCQIAQRLNSDRSMVCVEADPRLLAALRQNLATHATHCQAHALSGAVSYSPANPDQVLFEAKGNHLGSKLASSGSQREPSANSESRYLEIPVRTLDQVWKEHIRGEFQLVLDIEGAEIGLIEQEAEALAACRLLVIECHRTEWQGQVYDVESLIQKLEQRHHFKLVDRYGPVCCFAR